jgi:predicted dithiol-disulfide oxidoreductase (DUF899 family)
MAIAFPGESAEYRAARDRLLEQEIELRRAMEAVAAARRRLPPGGNVPQDYVFHAQGPGGAPAGVRLSELFAPGKDSLVIYSMMFPRARDDDSSGPQAGQTALLPLAEGPCPSCTALLDQLDGAAETAWLDGLASWRHSPAGKTVRGPRGCNRSCRPGRQGGRHPAAQGPTPETRSTLM